MATGNTKGCPCFDQKQIKQMKPTQNAYSDARLRFEAVIETATDGIILIDELGCMELANIAAARLFGYEVDEMIGQNVHMLMPSPHRENHNTYLKNYRDTGIKRIIGIGREVEGLKKTGDTFPFRLSISEVILHDRRIFTGIIHDLTDQKAAEERIRQLNAELEQRVDERTEELATAVNQLLNINHKLEFEIQERKTIEQALRKSESELRNLYEREKELNNLKSRFVAMASHEFRTPLSAILSSADLIEAYQEGGQQEKRLRHTNRIKSAVSNLTSILNDFLSLSKLEEGKVQCEPVPCSIASFCNEVLEELHALLKPGQHIRSMPIPEELEIIVDKKLLKNVLYNLLSNAIKYSPDGKPIDFLAAVHGAQLQIRIRDYGIGIPEEEQQHLFTRFFRAHNVENIQGTGLGLNIVKRYLELMQGNITFESKLGEGTEFSIQIPVHFA